MLRLLNHSIILKRLCLLIITPKWGNTTSPSAQNFKDKVFSDRFNFLEKKKQFQEYLVQSYFAFNVASCMLKLCYQGHACSIHAFIKENYV